MTSDTDRFFNWLERTEAAAYRSTVGKRMTRAGFEVRHTGGGCLAWERVINGYCVWITVLDGVELGERLDEPYMIGVYDAEFCEVACTEAKDLKGIIRLAGEAEHDIPAFIKKYPYNTEAVVDRAARAGS